METDTNNVKLPSGAFENTASPKDNSTNRGYNNQKRTNINYNNNNDNNRKSSYNNNTYNNNNNNYNRNNNTRGRGGARTNTVNRQQRHQDRARAALANTLVECSLPSIPLTTDGKVCKQILLEGSGTTPSPTSVLAINYVCRLSDGTVLDAFVDPQLPTLLNLNKVTLTPALEMCVLGMKLGEKCLLTSSFEYGYGELGCPDRIPPAANLQYEIELFWFNDDFATVDDGTVAGRLAVAEQSKLSGNHFYKLKMHRAAVRSYKFGESRLQQVVECTEEEQKRVDEMLVILNLNLAASALQTKLFDIAIMNCDKVLTLDPRNIKGLFRLSQAYAGQYDFKNAKAPLITAIKLKPNDLSLREEYEKLKKKETSTKQNSEGGLRGIFNKENSIELFKENEMEEMKSDRIALAGARVFM